MSETFKPGDEVRVTFDAQVRAVGPTLLDVDCNGITHTVRISEATRLHIEECRMTLDEWDEWSNDLANLLPEEYDGDAAQESIIMAAVKDLVEERATIGRVEAALLQWCQQLRAIPYRDIDAVYESGPEGTLQALREAADECEGRLRAALASPGESE